MTEYQFPEFVADQLLTAEDLNNMFIYLDEQERLTRTTMIGIGIICGLDVKTAADGTSLTITRGGGDTSEGYLMRLETETFFEYKAFDVLKPKYYDVFVNSTVEVNGDIKRTPKFPIWELFSKAETDAQPLTKAFLSDKVVLLFYEMMEIDAKNCDPTTCDDKGRDVLVTIRKLLINRSDAETILPKEDKSSGSGLPLEELLAQKLKLPDLRIRRFDVGATNLVDTNDIYEAYQKIFNKNLVNAVDNALYQMHQLYKYLVKDVISGNPFNNFGSKFAFLHNGTINDNNLLHFQYYYGFFYDMLQAYEELRCLGIKISAQCCPDANLFPRHLLLGEAIPDPGLVRSKYRNYFIPSPILNGQSEMVVYFRVLYRRLVLMINNVNMPVPSVSLKNGIDSNIRITPSKLGCVELANKAIPYYYKVNEESGRLYLTWGYRWHCKFKPEYVLSYNAKDYASDDFIVNPLSYDIEPYNFYRIEGHIGKNYKSALSAITSIRNNARLPFDVVAVTASLNDGEIDFKKMYCHFHDLETLYDSIKAELICSLCKLAVYYYDFLSQQKGMSNISLIPALPLLKACAPDFRLKLQTLGHEFELLWPSAKNQNDVNLNFFLNPNYFPLLMRDSHTIRHIIIFFLEKMFEQLGEDFAAFNFEQFKYIHGKLITVMKAVREYLKNVLLEGDNRGPQIAAEDEIDHLDALLHVCTSKALEALQKEYGERLAKVRGLTQLSKFVEKHPGIEHKGGVPKGGTFILVYFEKQKEAPAAQTFEFNIDSAEFNANRFDARTEKMAAKKNMTSEKLFEDISSQLLNFGLAEDIILNLKDVILGFKPDKAGLFDAKLANYADGTVVADFYIPYLCCSDCPPVQYFITESTVVLTLSLDKNEFCSHDDKQYNFKVSPAGGTVTGEGVTSKDDGAGGKVYLFSPAGLTFNGDEKQKEVIFTYKLDDQETTFKITVYRMPVAQFDATNVPGAARQVLFENKSKFGTLYEWDFGESDDASDTSTIEQPGTRTYKDEGSYTVTLKVTNGVCSKTETKVVTIAPLGAVSISLDKIQFCNDENGPFLFTVTPEGTTVEGEKVTQVGDKFGFMLPVDLGGADQKPVQFKGTAPDGRTATFDVTVFEHPPKPSFSFERPGTNNEVTFIVKEAKFAKSYKWSFGDGQTQETTESKISHTYLNNGVFVVSLRSINGPCASEPQIMEVPVQQVLRLLKTCAPLPMLIADFDAISTMEGFDQFVKSYKIFGRQATELYPLIKGLMDTAKNVQFMSREEQLHLLTQRSVDDILKLLLPVTRKMIYESESRLVAIVMYRILMRLAMLVACLKETDIGVDKPDLAEIFKLIRSGVKEMTDKIPQDDERSVIVRAIKQDVKDEQDRIKNNNEDKPTYRVVMQSLEDVLKHYN